MYKINALQLMLIEYQYKRSMKYDCSIHIILYISIYEFQVSDVVPNKTPKWLIETSVWVGIIVRPSLVF